MQMRFRSLCLGVLACASPVVLAEAYKWIDADGKVHYSQEKPVGQSADAVKLRRSVPPPTAVPGKDAGTKAARPTAAAKPTPVAPPTLTPEAREAKCQEAKSRFASMESTPRVFRQEASGERVRLTEEERQEALSREKNDVDKYCQP